MTRIRWAARPLCRRVATRENAARGVCLVERVGGALVTLSGKIDLRTEGGLVPMQEERYDAEDDLQRLLADYPDLLAGDQVRPSSPRRWLLI